MRWIAFFAFLLPLVGWTLTASFPSTTQRSADPTPTGFGKDTLILENPFLGDLVFSDFFSPNDDGHNDTYIILNVENYSNNSLKVFNRWGEVVYYASPYLNDWDGTNNQATGLFGKKLTDGIYYFEFYNGNDRGATGKITLKR